MITRRHIVLGAAALATFGLPLPAQALAFDGSWTHQKFPRRPANVYRQNGASLEVASDAAVSLLIRELPQDQWATRRASWSWSVSEGVPATDLARKGGDDRNLALYFAFLPQAEALRLKGSNPRKVLTSKAARTLVYIWGGQAARGAMQSSPYSGDRGRNVLLRPASTGSFTESVDLAADHRRAFGTAPEALLGIGVSADSDDTATRIRARIEGLILRA